MIIPPRIWAPLALTVPLFLAACEMTATQNGEDPPEPGVLEATRFGPPGAPEGTCWGKTVTPAVVQTVTRQVLVKAAVVNDDGTIGAPPKYRTTETQDIVTPRRDNWFETPCPEALSPEFISTLQRALSVRGLYAGQINGMMNPATRAAIQGLQRAAGGPDSPVLTLETARTLGLIAVPRQPSE